VGDCGGPTIFILLLFFGLLSLWGLFGSIAGFKEQFLFSWFVVSWGATEVER
jgi:hypothetical protein